MLVMVAAMMYWRPMIVRSPTAHPAAWLSAAVIVLGLGTAPATAQSGRFKDGEFTGVASETGWGEVQVKAVIQGGALADVKYLQFPDHRRRSVQISNAALPLLRAEALQTQSARVHILSSATATAESFRESLASALAQAAKTPAT